MKCPNCSTRLLHSWIQLTGESPEEMRVVAFCLDCFEFIASISVDDVNRHILKKNIEGAFDRMLVDDKHDDQKANKARKLLNKKYTRAKS